jgi:hypothetical protein
MEYGKDPIIEFARRTKCNLDHIQEQVEWQKSKRETPALYEVTQLINSLLGIIVHPKESLPPHFFDIELDKLYQKGWPEFRLATEEIDDHCITLPQTLLGLLRLMRNAIAHNQIAYISLPPDTGDIESIHFWNKPGKNKIWEIEVSINQLRKFVTLLLDHIISQDGES